MLNIFKMYCYKMFRQKSLYVALIITLFFVFLSIQMTEGGFVENSVEMGAFYILLTAIFPTIFFSADISSGFIKNYAGMVSHKGIVIVARAAMTFVQNLLTLAVVFASLYAVAIFSGTGIGNISFVLKYYVCVFLSGLACSFMGIMVSELLRKTVAAVILIISIGTGLISQILSLISLLITNNKFNIGRFTVTGTFTPLNLDSAPVDFSAAVIVAVCYIAVSFIVALISIEKRDIV